MGQVLVREYRENDIPGIIKLLKLCFRDWPKVDTDLSPRAYWEWKYLKSPRLGNNLILDDDGQIVGCHHTSRVSIKICDRVYDSVSAQDFAIHPDYRGQRLSSKISRHNEDMQRIQGITLRYFITRSPVLIKKYSSSPDLKSRRPIFPKKIINMTWIKDLDAHLEAMPEDYMRLKKLGFNILKVWNRYTVKKESCNPYLETTSVTDFQELSPFLEEVVSEHSFIVVRTPDYLNWKYMYPGIGNYRVTQVKEGDRVLGYSVLRVNRYNREYPVGYIVDLLTHRNRVDAVHSLLYDARTYFDSENVNIVNSQILKGHFSEPIYRAHGFLNSRKPIRLYFNLEAKNIFASFKHLDSDLIYISWGDHDVLPVGKGYD